MNRQHCNCNDQADRKETNLMEDGANKILLMCEMDVVGAGQRKMCTWNNSFSLKDVKETFY